MVWLYLLPLSALKGALPDYRARISPAQYEVLARRPLEEQLRGLGGELLFQEAVCRHRPQAPRPALRESAALGKPALLGDPTFHFSLSHSGGWAVCAVSSRPVGVDIQRLRPVSPRLAGKFTPSEQQELAALPPEAAQERLFQLWVLKESYVKCTGQGLLCPFRSFEAVSPAAGYCSLLLPFPDPDYALGLCTRGEAVREVALAELSL